MTGPLLYAHDVERPLPDEAAIDSRLTEAMRGIGSTTFADYGHAVRTVHAKSHALVEGELTVPDDLPEPLAQGLFAQPRTYSALLRFSCNPGDVLDDDVTAPRGVAIKVLEVDGERLPGSEGDRTQDFVMVNAPAFSAKDAAAFEGSLKLLAATTDTGQAWKKMFAGTLRGVEGALEAVGGESPTLINMGGQKQTHPLGETYYTTTPFRHGAYVAKLSLAPVSPELVALKGREVSTRGRPNGLREELIEFFRDTGGEWELRAQLRTDAETMPIEDASAEWPEAESPYLAVARIRVAPQPAWSEARARQVDDGLAFSPWHGLAAHRPLGSINRSRKESYAVTAEERGARNGCPMAEPRGRVRLSDDPAQVYGSAPGREGRRPGTPDARPGKWGQTMNETARHLVAGAAGGLAAGALLSGMMLAQEKLTGEPNELLKLERRSEGQAEIAHPPEQAPGSLAEQLAGHAGHLALSAIAGAAYGAVHRDRGSPVLSGLALGASFWALAYGVVGPTLGVAPKPWRDNPGDIVMHGMFHAIFGVGTALAADRVAKRL